MKKVFFISAMILASVFTLVSCGKEEEKKPGTPPRATIKGIVYADLDLTNTDLEFAPEGTKLFFRVEAKDLMLSPDANVDYETLVYTATVGNKGEYSISLPSANHQAVTVKISGNEFRVEQELEGEDEMTRFYLAPVTQNTMGGQEYILDLTYAY